MRKMILLSMGVMLLMPMVALADTPADRAQDVGYSAGNVGGGPITDTFVTTDEATWQGMVTVDFTSNVGQDSAGNALPDGTSQWDGRDIQSTGINLDYSSPGGANPILVTVSPGHPELGPTGPGGENFCGDLMLSFDVNARAVAVGHHLLGRANIILFDRAGNVMSNTPVDGGGGIGYIGVVDDRGFAAMMIQSNGNCFWDIDGSPDHAARLEGQKATAGRNHCLYVATKVKPKKTNECLERCDRAPYQVGDRICGVACNDNTDCDAKLKIFVGCANGAAALVKGELIGCQQCDGSCP